MKKENPAVAVWDILYPLLMYETILVLVMYAAQIFLGTESSTYMLRQILATVVALPIVYALFYRPDVLLVQAGKNALKSGKVLRMLLPIILVSALLGVALNNLLAMSPLIAMSEGYARASEDFYAGSFALEILGSALLTPVLEELIFRGIIYTRLKRHLKIAPAVVLSALIFGLIHWNIVQFLYAFLLGIMLALFMERTGHFLGAVAGHMTVNFISVVRTETGILEKTTDKSMFAWTISVVLLLAGLLLLYVWFGRTNFRHNSDTISK